MSGERMVDWTHCSERLGATDESMASDFNIATPYTSLVPSLAGGPTSGPHRPPRFGLGVRVRAFIKLAELDQLWRRVRTPGTARSWRCAHSSRRSQRKRIRLARAIERVTSDAGSP